MDVEGIGIPGSVRRLAPEKLRAPVIAPAVLPRPRLYARLDTATEPIHLVVGLAGCGKSTLLASWSGIRGDVAWLDLDRGDNDPDRFWSYACAAVRGDPPGRSARPGRDAGTGPGTLDFLAELRASAYRVLVLDNAHELRNPVLLEQLGRVLEHLPAGRRIVLSGRRSSGLPIARARLAGRLATTTGDDLACTPEETAALCRLGGVELTAADLARLGERSRGWVASLRFAQPDPGSLASIDPNLLEYIDAEVFDDLSAGARELLTATAWFDPVPRGLAEELCGVRTVERAYRELERLRPLVTCRGPTWTNLRRAPLFRAYLVGRTAELASEQAGRLRERAASWYLGARRIQEAARAAIDLRDWALLAAIVSQDQLGSDFGDLLFRVPDSAIESDPRLVAAVARARLDHADLVCAEHLVRLLEADPDRELDALALRLQADALGGRVDESAGRRARQRARQLVGSGAETPALVVRLGVAELAAARFGSAREVLDRRLDLRSGAARMLVTRALALGCALDGSLAYAEELLVRSATPADGPLDGLDLARAVVDLERGRLAPADALLDRIAAEVAPDRTPFGNLTDILRVRLAMLRGALDDARRLAHELGRVRRPDPLTRLLATSCRVDLALADGAWDAARALLGGMPRSAAWAARAGRLALVEDDPGRALRAVDPWTYAWPADADPARTGPPAGGTLEPPAERTLEPPADRSPGHPADRIVDRIDALLVRAGALRMVRRNDEAAVSVSRALAMAEPEGLMTVFLAGGRFVRQALTVTASPGEPCARFRQAILRGFDLQAAPVGSAPRRTGPELTESERSVLAYLVSPLTNAEVADDLYLSVNTVKSHLRTLYRKLGVSSRRDAVVRARYFGLLPDEDSPGTPR